MRLLVSLFILLASFMLLNLYNATKPTNTSTAVNTSKSNKLKLTVINPLSRAKKIGSIEGASVVQIYSAKNEVEPFQFVISTHKQAVTIDSISLNPLRNKNNETITQISIFKEHYVPVLTPSHYSPYPPQSYPDALIPIRQGSSTQPIKIKAQENLPIWVDINVPETQPAGDYHGKLIVKTRHQGEYTLPITLTVWNFTLPKRTPLRTLVGIDAKRVVNIYNPAASEPWSSVDWQHVRDYYDFLLDHHLSAGEFADASPFPSENNKQLIDDSLIPGLGTINENMQHYIFEKNASTYIYAFGQSYKDNPSKIGYPFNDMLNKNRAKAQHFLASYTDWCHQFLSSDRCQLNYAAFVDEPGYVDEYSILRQWGRFVQETEKLSENPLNFFVSESPVPNTKNTNDPNDGQRLGKLTGYANGWNIPTSDLWMLINGSHNVLNERLALGEPIYAHALPLAYLPRIIPKQYESNNLHGNFIGRWLDGTLCNKRYPNLSKCTLQSGIPGGTRGIDYPPINYRITAWLVEPYGISGIEEWDSIYWNKDKNGNDIDVWKTAKNIANNADEDPVNGDGMLIYPGKKENIGFDGPVASIRLKWLREAVEDFSYIKLLRAHHEDNFIKEQTSPFIRNLGDWDNKPDLLMHARKAFGEKLHRLNKH